MGQLSRTLVRAHGRPSRCRAFSALFPRAHSLSLQLRKGGVEAARAAPPTRARGAQTLLLRRSLPSWAGVWQPHQRPPRDLAEEGLAAAAGALYAEEGVDTEEGHVYSEEELRRTFSRAEAREVVNTMEAMMRRIEGRQAAWPRCESRTPRAGPEGACWEQACTAPGLGCSSWIGQPSLCSRLGGQSAAGIPHYDQE